MDDIQTMREALATLDRYRRAAYPDNVPAVVMDETAQDESAALDRIEAVVKAAREWKEACYDDDHDPLGDDVDPLLAALATLDPTEAPHG